MYFSFIYRSLKTLKLTYNEKCSMAVYTATLCKIFFITLQIIKLFKITVCISNLIKFCTVLTSIGSKECLKCNALRPHVIRIIMLNRQDQQYFTSIFQGKSRAIYIRRLSRDPMLILRYQLLAFCAYFSEQLSYCVDVFSKSVHVYTCRQ